MSAAPRTVSRLGYASVTAWALFVAAILAVVGGAAAWVAAEHRRAADARHAARMDPTANEPGFTAADATLPPDANPVRVRAGVYVDRVVELSVRDMTWVADFYIWFRWSGDALDPGEQFQVIGGSIESKELAASVNEGAERYALYRVAARITKPFSVVRFPCDDHLLTIDVESTAWPRDRLLFEADAENTAVSSRVTVPGYRVSKLAVVEKSHAYKTTRGDPRIKPGAAAHYSQLRVGIWIAREGWGYPLKLFLALYVSVAVAFLAFFIKPTDLDPRFGVGVGALFAAVANSYVAANLVPDTGELSLADTVNGLGIVTILLSLIHSTASLYIYAHVDKPRLSEWLDRIAFVALAATYVAVNVAVLWAAWG